MTNLSTRLQFQSFAVNADELPQQSIDALLQLGFSTKIKNAIAGVRAGVLGTGATPWSHDQIEREAIRAGLSTWGADDHTAQAICDLYQKEMFNSILTGIAPQRASSAPRLSDDDKLRRTVAVEMLEAWARQQGRALPKRSKPDEKEAFNAYLAKALEKPKFAAAVEKEFTRRKATKGVDSLDDLLD